MEQPIEKRGDRGGVAEQFPQSSTGRQWERPPESRGVTWSSFAARQRMSRCESGGRSVGFQQQPVHGDLT